MDLKLSENALTVLKKRYLRKDKDGNVAETPEELFLRVSQAVAEAENNYGVTKEQINKLSSSFYNMMANLEFMPNSPTLMNAGLEMGQLSACFVLPVDDSMEGIFDTLKACALIHKTGGGTGFSFSNLRSKNTVVRTTGGFASGPVSFMKVFDSATQAVKQGGRRRGANMGILRVDHPDILEFIKCKETEGDINNFNISIGITDKFMEKVFAGQDYDLIDPHSKEVKGRLNALEVFDLITEYAHKNGEPGVIFLDNINKDNPTPNLGDIESTNPCLTSDDWVMTKNGPFQVMDLIGEKFTAVVDGKKYLSGKRGFFKTGFKPVYRLITKEGFEVRSSMDHPFLRVINKTRHKTETDWTKLEDLNVGDRLLLNNHNSLTSWPGKYSAKEGYMIGLLIGDGTVKKDKAVLSSWGNSGGSENVRESVVDLLKGFKYRKDFSGWTSVKGRNEYRLSCSSLTDLSRDLGLKPRKKSITKVIESGSSEFCKGLIQGLFDSDGTVIGNQAKGVSVRLAQSDMSLLKAVQRILLRFGIYSKIYSCRRKEQMHKLPDGKGGLKEYWVRAQHELSIANSSILKFYQRIGFKDTQKQERLKVVLNKYNRKMNKDFFAATIEDIVFDGMEKVFDVQIPGKNCFDANGFVAHNCGEQPLLPYESCNLGSINLAKMVNQEVESYSVDWDKLKRTVRLAVNFLDNVIEINKFPISEIRKKNLKTRKIGLGVMGWATFLGYLGIPYDSEEALGLAKEIMCFVKDQAVEVSKELAESKGEFSAYKGSVFESEGVKLRNATLTTIAPTGTISIIAGPASSGIEPIFALVYHKNVLEGEDLFEVDPAFEAIAKQRGFYSEALLERIAQNNGSIQDIREIPTDVKEVFRTSMDIKADWHVKMQAAFQEHTDNAVSKTINLPNSAKMQDIKDIYFLSYKLGCKGITVYRDGSRQSQVLTVKKKTAESIEQEVRAKLEKEVVNAPKPRPAVIIGTTTKINTGCGNLYVTINQDKEGEFFEVFTQMGKAGGCAASQLEAVGRLVSSALRGGIDLKVIIEQLKGIRCPSPSWSNGRKIFSCADAIAQVLEKRMLDQHNITQVENPSKDTREEESEKLEKALSSVREVNVVGVCPDCGDSLRSQEGCVTCASCGYSRC